MADFNTPTTSTAYATVLANLKDRDTDALSLCLVDPTNIPTGAIKYNRVSNKFQEWNGSAWVDKVLALAGGGTGGTDAASARTALGLGSISTQDANAVAITGGTLAGVTAPASIITSGTVATARLGSGAGGTGTLFLADDSTWKTGVPVGAGNLWFTNTPPTGYLICDGSSVLRATYADLFAIIGTVYGSVDGTHFNLPDLRQRFPIGKAASGTANTLAATGGAIDHTHTSAAHTHTMGNHTHSVPSLSVPSLSIPALTVPGLGYSGSGTTGPNSDAFGVTVGSDRDAAASLHTHDYTWGGTTSSGSTSTGVTGTGSSGTGTSGAPSTNTSDSTTPGATGSNNPPYIVINYIIKY